MTERERIPSAISAERSKYDNCNCDMCHGLGYVAKVHYPIVRYYDGNNLTAKEHVIWICDECRNKLIDILMSTYK